MQNITPLISLLVFTIKLPLDYEAPKRAVCSKDGSTKAPKNGGKSN